MTCTCSARTDLPWKFHGIGCPCACPWHPIQRMVLGWGKRRNDESQARRTADPDQSQQRGTDTPQGGGVVGHRAGRGEPLRRKKR